MGCSVLHGIGGRIDSHCGCVALLNRPPVPHPRCKGSHCHANLPFSGMASCSVAVPGGFLSNGILPLFSPSNLHRGVRFQPRENNPPCHVVRANASRRLLGGPEGSGKIKRASRKALSIILEREAAQAEIEKNAGPNKSNKLLPRTVLEALTDRIQNNQWQAALRVFELLREQLWYKPNPKIYTKLLAMLSKCRQHEQALSLFELMVEDGCDPSVETYTALASAYSRSGLLDQAFCILDGMKGIPHCQPDVFTYSILIKSCVEVSRFDHVDRLLSEMSSSGIKPNTVTYNTILEAYGKAGKFREMEDILSNMLEHNDCKPDVWTMNATIRAFGHRGHIEMMEICYEKFKRIGIQPNVRTFNILMYSYGKGRLYDKMTAVMEYMQKYYFSWTTVTYNVVIDAFGRAGEVEQMEFLFRLMRSEGLKPDCITLCSLVSAYGKAGALQKITRVMRLLENSDIVPDTAFFNSVIDAYRRAGDLAEMEQVLVQMKEKGCKPDKITFTTMIKAYLSKGMLEKVQELEQQMHNMDLIGFKCFDQNEVKCYRNR